MSFPINSDRIVGFGCADIMGGDKDTREIVSTEVECNRSLLRNGVDDIVQTQFSYGNKNICGCNNTGSMTNRRRIQSYTGTTI